MNPTRFDEKHVVITGGASGIGQAMAFRFAEEGAQVRILDVSQDDAEATVNRIVEEGGLAAYSLGDVSDPKVVDALFESLAPVDILVNNAGIAHVGNVENTTVEDFDRVMRVNVRGVFLCSRAAIGGMVRRKRGVILNMASIASHLGIHDRFAYSASKGAVLTMTLSLARDYIDHGIRCNCLCPARVHTPFVDGYLRQNYPGREKEVFEKLSAYQPIGRMAEPAEIAGLAAFLCSDEASFITGCAYDIDGGVTRLR